MLHKIGATFGRTRLMVMGVVTLSALSVGTGASSLAVFTDQETTTGTFTAGTIVLDAAKVDALVITNTNLVPGDVVTGSVDVENDGLNALAYSLNTATTAVAGPSGGVLNTALTVEVKGVDVTDPATKCDVFDGAVIVASEVLGTTNVMFGDPSPTVNTTDRTVAAGATDVLCIRITLPLATGNTMQGATATTTFTFDAEQTENN
jgi:spore coat-associated protein N